MFNLLDIIFPPKCLNCKEEGSVLCNECFGKIELRKQQSCPICKKVNMRGKVCGKCVDKTSLNGLFVATSYGKKSIIRKVITQFKYKFSERLGERLGEVLYQPLDRLRNDIQLKQSVDKEGQQHASVCCLGDEAQYSQLVPVPLHFLRKWQRGYNQAELLANQVSQKSGVSVSNLLKRIKNTPQQAKLNRERRLENISGAFRINQKKLHEIRNKSQQRLTPTSPLKGVSNKLQTTDYQLPTIILIDDVASTLSTLEECAKELKRCGFDEVWGLVIARG